jgi:HK97 family phage major capsid protein
MKRSDEFKQEREEKRADMRKIADAAKGRKMSTEERTRFDALKKDIDQLNEDIDTYLVMETEEREAATTEAGSRRPAGHRPQTTSRARPFADYARALFDGRATKIDQDNAGEFSKPERRTSNSTTMAGGIQNPLIGSDAIYTSLAQNYLAQLGVDVFDLKANYYQLPKVTGYTALTGFTEAQDIPLADPTIVPVKFTAKNYGVLVKVHNNVLRDAGPMAEQIIQGIFDRAVQDMFIKEILYGTAGANGVTGLDTFAGVQTVDAASAILTDYSLLTNAAQKALTANATIDQIGYLMHPIAWEQLQSAADSTGQPLVMPRGLDGRPMAVSTAVKINYGGTTDETRIYAGNWNTVKLGLEGRYEMRLDQTFAASDITAFAVVVRADLQVFEPTQLAIIANIATA